MGDWKGHLYGIALARGAMSGELLWDICALGITSPFFSWFLEDHGVVKQRVLRTRQWPEVYNLCHTFLHVAKRVRFSHGRVFSDSRNVQKQATKSDTSGHCLLRTVPLRSTHYWASRYEFQRHIQQALPDEIVMRDTLRAGFRWHEILVPTTFLERCFLSSLAQSLPTTTDSNNRKKRSECSCMISTTRNLPFSPS